MDITVPQPNVNIYKLDMFSNIVFLSEIVPDYTLIDKTKKCINYSDFKDSVSNDCSYYSTENLCSDGNVLDGEKNKNKINNLKNNDGMTAINSCCDCGGGYKIDFSKRVKLTGNIKFKSLNNTNYLFDEDIYSNLYIVKTLENPKLCYIFLYINTAGTITKNYLYLNNSDKTIRLLPVGTYTEDLDINNLIWKIENFDTKYINPLALKNIATSTDTLITSNIIEGNIYYIKHNNIYIGVNTYTPTDSSRRMYTDIISKSFLTSPSVISIFLEIILSEYRIVG